MLHYNSLLSLPVIFLIALLTGELSKAPSAAAAAIEQTSAFTLALALGGCAGGGLLLNYATMLCTSTNSALTTTVVGVLKGVVGTLGGFFVGGGARFSNAGLVGVAMNTAGGVAYSYAKFEEKRAKRAAMAAMAAQAQARESSSKAGGQGGWVDVRADGGQGGGGGGGGGAHARKPAASRGVSGEASPLLG